MIRPLSSLLVLIALAGCQPRTAQPPAAPGGAGEGQQEVAARVAELDRKIAAIEGRMAADQPAGTGAYARGTTLRVEGDGRESVLERLRRLERELAAANATAAAKERTIGDLTRQRDEARATGREAGERADYLSRTRDDLAAAQQTLAERQERIDALSAQVAVGELQRLRAERRWYALAGEVLHLTPDDARDLPEIQGRIRDATRDVREGAKP